METTCKNKVIVCGLFFTLERSNNHIIVPRFPRKTCMASFDSFSACGELAVTVPQTESGRGSA